MLVLISTDEGLIVEALTARDFDGFSSPDHFDKIAPAYLGYLTDTGAPAVLVHYVPDSGAITTERHTPAGARDGAVVGTRVEFIGTPWLSVEGYSIIREAARDEDGPTWAVFSPAGARVEGGHLDHFGAVMGAWQHRTDARVEACGREDGESAATWYSIDSSAVARQVLAGIEDCDPEILDTFPAPDFSGQWADGDTVAAMLARADVELDDDDDQGRDYYAGIYEDAYREAVEFAIAQECRAYLRAMMPQELPAEILRTLAREDGSTGVMTLAGIGAAGVGLAMLAPIFAEITGAISTVANLLGAL